MKNIGSVKFLTERRQKGVFLHCQVKEGRAVTFQKPQGRSLFLSETSGEVSAIYPFYKLPNLLKNISEVWISWGSMVLDMGTRGLKSGYVPNPDFPSRMVFSLVT